MSAERAAADFREIERVHALLDHPLIPKVAARGVASGIPYLELACDAVIDGVDLHDLLLDTGQKVPHGSAAGLAASLFQAMRAAHAVTDPERGGPVCLGRICCANILFSPEGQSYLVGYGRNFPLERVSGGYDHPFPVCEAPEVAVGGEPTPTSDYVALSLFKRSLLHLVEVCPAITRVLTGRTHAADLEILECLRWLEQHFIGAVTGMRKSVEEAEAVVDRLHALSGVRPDPARFAALVADLLAWGAPLLPEKREAQGGPPTLVFGLELSWVAGADGVQHPLGHALGRITTALVDRHSEAPGASLTLEELLEAGWPGERLMAEAGANRVYVALAHLRRMGLRGLLEHDKHGYRLAPATVVRVVKHRADRSAR